MEYFACAESDKLGHAERERNAKILGLQSIHAERSNEGHAEREWNLEPGRLKGAR